MITGCNYWASHAGIRMWSDWREEVVREDFRKIASTGISVVRTFPLWPEFQPLTLLRSAAGRCRELSFGDCPLPPTEAGRAGVDETMVERLLRLLDLAREAGLKVELGLVTGWMSGRLFVPPAFEGRNVLTDPLVIRWQVRFVRYLVRRCKDHPAVAAWSPGNECNCLGRADRHQAWVWCDVIAAAIRREDPSRPVSGGMHSLSPAVDAGFEEVDWSIQDHGELFDRVNTHPYPLFTPHAATGRIDAFRNLFHAVAETRFYSDIAGIPGAIEEIGTLSSSFAGEAVKAGYIRNVIFNALAHDIPLLAWWCAFEQRELVYAPYDWNAVERELGLFYSDGTPKPVAEMFTAVNAVLAALPPIAPAAADAVCVLSKEQDAWSNAWGAMLLAEQVGLRLRFAFTDAPLPESGLYLVPGVFGDSALSRRTYQELIGRARNGATVYFSLDDGVLSPLDDLFGIRSLYRETPDDEVVVSVGGQNFPLRRPVRYAIEPDGAAVAGTLAGGEGVFFDHRCGKGRLLLLTLPLERYAVEQGTAVNRPDEWSGRAVYGYFGDELAARHAARSGDPLATVSCHPVSGREMLVIAVNNRPEAAAFEPLLAPGWKVGEFLYGTPGGLAAHDGAVFRVVKR